MRPGSGMVIPRPALKNRAAPGIVSLRIGSSSIMSVPMLSTAPTPKYARRFKSRDERFARRAEMDVGVDQHRHHGLAGEAHARGAGRHANVGGRAGLHDSRAVHDQCPVFDRASVAHDKPRAFEHGDAGLRVRRGSEPGKDTNGKGCSGSD